LAGVLGILHALSVWTIISFVKDCESRIDRITGKGEPLSSRRHAEDVRCGVARRKLRPILEAEEVYLLPHGLPRLGQR
jgi:hypothetical protein